MCDWLFGLVGYLVVLAVAWLVVFGLLVGSFVGCLLLLYVLFCWLVGLFALLVYWLVV